MLPMNPQLQKYAEEDLSNELKYLLCAATEWDAQDKLIGEPPRSPKIGQPCFHLKVYTMDSALLHARSLHEFFYCHAQQEEKKAVVARLRPAGVSGSSENQTLIDSLNPRVAHIDKNRSKKDEIKSEVISLACHILDLWTGFGAKPGLHPYESLLCDLRRKAIKEARDVARQYEKYGYACPFA